MTYLVITSDALKKVPEDVALGLLNDALEHGEIEPEDALEMAFDCGFTVNLQLVRPQ